jgi:hypothetical protein
VLQAATFNSFLPRAAGNLLRDVASLEEQSLRAAGTREPKVREALAALRRSCQQLIDLETGLSSALPLQQLKTVVSQLPTVRAECVQRIQELEAVCHTPQPFYQSRPSNSTVAVDNFLSDLERMFTEEWATANAGVGSPVQGG